MHIEAWCETHIETWFVTHIEAWCETHAYGVGVFRSQTDGWDIRIPSSFSFRVGLVLAQVPAPRIPLQRGSMVSP